MLLQIITKIKVIHQGLGQGHIKVKSQSQGHMREKYNFTYFKMLIIWMLLQIIISSRSHIKVNVTTRSK